MPLWREPRRLMFEFKVLGLDEAQVEFVRGWPTCIVGLLSDLIPLRGPHHLHIVVDDVRMEASFVLAPTRAMIEEVFAHVAHLTDEDRLLVHCLAGQSRSTAMMIGILILHGIDPLIAFDLVKEHRPASNPNPLIIQHIDDHFGLDGILVRRNSLRTLHA